MLEYSIIFLILTITASVYSESEEYGSKYTPTKGEVWPRPQSQTTLGETYKYLPQKFYIKIIGHKCPILINAVQRFKGAVNTLYNIGEKSNKLRREKKVLTADVLYHRNIQKLSVELKNPCEEYPHFEMDEKYDLIISQTSVLIAESVWGILRGLETAAQLFYLSDDFTEVQIKGVKIKDFPTYPHRGLLLDTARHYLSVDNIKTTLDAMAMNKMNVFHWHIVDDQSFPYQSAKYPALSGEGAFYPTMVYTMAQIKDIIEYARYHGIRVIPEFDMPGHSKSWGMSNPELLTECYEDYSESSLGPLNPLSSVSHDLIKGLLQEVTRLFPDNFLHFGGDEVDLMCWVSNPYIQNYMKKNNMIEINEVLELFTLEVMGYVNNTPIVWQDMFDNAVDLPNNTIVQVWKTSGDRKMLQILNESKLRVIFSSLWYLDSNKPFEEYYIEAPRVTLAKNSTELHRIVGGEACLWGEMVDDTNVLTRTWPRACATAEVLWSAPLLSTTDTWRRIEEHTCRMRRRGIPTEPPTGASFCVL